MNAVVLDTSIASFMFKASPLLSPYKPHLENAVCFLSFQTVAEMRLGARVDRWGLKQRQALEMFLANFQIVAYSDILASDWASIMHEARQAGRRLESGDGWIAATALLLSAPLLTHDRDFDAQACPSIIVIRYTP